MPDRADQQAPPQITPRRLGDYLDVMSKSVFQSGISWKVVEAKWPELRAAFRDFDAQAVAGLSEPEIEALAADPRVIRNRRKIEAIVGNAQRMLDLEAEHGSFRAYLRAQPDFEARVQDLRTRFKFLGDMGAYIFLYVVGEPVPPHEEWEAAHRPARPRPARSGTGRRARAR